MIASLVRPIAVTKSGCGGLKRRGAHAVDDALERELQLMRLVQRHFQHPRDHLRAPGQALRRRVNHRQSRRRDPAIARHFLHDLGRRRTSAFDDERGDIGFVPIADVFEDRLLLRKRASRARAESKERVLAGAVRQAPTGVLAPKAGDDRLRRADRDRPGPARRRVVRRKPHGAKSAHTDFRDAQPSFDAAALLGAGVDQGFSERPVRQRRGSRARRRGCSAAVSSAARRLTLMVSTSLNGPSPERER